LRLVPAFFWLLALAQGILICESLTEDDSMSSAHLALPSALGLGSIVVLWLLRAWPFCLRAIVDARVDRWLRRRRIRQTRFYEFVAPPGSVGAETWPKPARVGPLRKERSEIRGLQRLEAAALILASFVTATAGSELSLDRRVCAAGVLAAVGFLRLACSSTTAGNDPACCRHCGMATIGSVAAATVALSAPFSIGLAGLPPLSLYVVVAPYAVASACLWLSATRHLRWVCNIVSPCCSNLDCDCIFTLIVRCVGVLTLWFTGISTLVRLESQLRPISAPLQWPSDSIVTWPAIVAPLLYNLIILGLLTLANCAA